MIEKEKRSFLPKIKKKEKVEVKEISQTKMNMYFLGGLIFLVVLAALSITSSLSRNFRSTNSGTTSTVVKKTNEVDNRLQLFLESYLTAYFTDSDESESERAEKLAAFYETVPEVKATNARKTTKLISYKLEQIKKEVAVYRVTYEIEDKRVTVLFGIPYAGKDGQYVVTGLPYYEAVTNYKAAQTKNKLPLKLDGKDDVTEEERKQLTDFLLLFFKNYTTSQDNLNIVAKDVKTINGAVFTSLDYTYFVIDSKENITAYVQASFDILGVGHSENFTFHISQKEDGSFYVDKMEHGIPSDYQTVQKKEAKE